MEEKTKNSICSCASEHPGIVVGLSIIIAAAIFSLAFYASRSQEDTLSVTGSAKKPVISDTVKWTGSFSRTVPQSDLKVGYDQMDRDLNIVRKFFMDQGITEKEYGVSPITISQPYESNYQVEEETEEYVLKQNIEVQSQNVDKITALAKSLQPLINQGVFFATEGVEYYYSKLPELRIELLGEAVKDAQVRAEEIAKNSGRSVGNIQSAGMGVVQVLSPNSVEVSDYGTYDTSSIEKEVMVTVKASFTLR